MPDVVNCILMNDDGEILILKRSEKVRTYRGCWGGVAGYVEKDEKPLDTAFKELREEVSLLKNDVELLKQGDPIEFTDFYEGEWYNWKIFPFLFKTEKKSKVHIDWEHTEYRWISPSGVGKYGTVPRFMDVVSMLIK